MAARTGQKLHVHALAVHENFVQEIKSKFYVQGRHYCVQRQMFVNMDGMAVLFEARPSSTVHHYDANTISVQFSGSNTRRLTACVSVCNDLSLLIIFKDEPNRHV